MFYNEHSGILTNLVDRASNSKKGSEVGCLSSDGYVYATVDGKQYLLHRLIWFYVYGYFPENEIDHINRKKSDNRIKNLREASRQCNTRNSGMLSTNNSGVKGVSWDKVNNKWMSCISIGNKTINLGRFVEKSGAAKARWEAEKKYGFPSCNTTSTAYTYLKERCLI